MPGVQNKAPREVTRISVEPRDYLEMKYKNLESRGTLQDGEVTTAEFKKAIQANCVGKAYTDFPSAFKMFIDGFFKTIDIDGNLCATFEFAR